MATIALTPLAPPPLPPVSAPAGRVVECYDVLDLCPVAGVEDFTDGKYLDDRNGRAAYLAAQQRQADYLLDQVRCVPGEKILDIGCGYGRVLRQARQRGLGAIGITVSSAQAAECRRRGLQATVLDYRRIPQYREALLGEVHGIVANGSLEHFAQLDDALAGRVDQVYEELFRICRSLLQPGERFVTTAIHFTAIGQANPWQIRQMHRAWPRDSFNRHLANLVEAFGGWYPEPGQLQRCAGTCFDLVAEEDGTHDYFLTSEYWLRQLRRSLATHPRVWRNVLRQWRRSPQALGDMLRCLWREESWNWQFRGSNPPMRLLRQTWEATA